MRPHHAADEIVSIAHIGDPIADALVDSVFERAAAGRHGAHFSAQQSHPKHIERLPPNVLFAHIDDALLIEHSAHGCGGDAVLSRPRFGYDAVLAHTLRQQRLPQRVVYLVRASVRQVFALEVYARAAKLGGEVFGVIQRRGTPHIARQKRPHLRLKRLVRLRRGVFALKLFHRAHKRFRHKAPPEIPEAPHIVGQRRRCAHCGHINIPFVALRLANNIIAPRLTLRNHNH